MKVLSTIAFVLISGVACIGQVAEHILEIKDIPHPRILFLSGEEGELTRAIFGSSDFRRIHDIIIAECNDILREEPVEYEKRGRRLLQVAREGRRRVFYLSYGWRLTKDMRYLNRAQSELLALCAFPDWNPDHFLDVAEITMACAVGYDWLYHSLPPLIRDQVAVAIVEKGLKPSQKGQYNRWLSADTNWNQVCNAGMAFGALAIMDREPVLANIILQRSVISTAIPMKTYGDDGAYPEGYGYWEYGTTFHVMLISALEKVLRAPIDVSDGFAATGKYILHMTGSSGKAFNYSDNHEDVSLHPAMFWFAARNNDPSLLFMELKALREGKKLHRVRELPLSLIWACSLDLASVNAPLETMWVSADRNACATLRSDWRGEGMFLGFKAGSPFFNHGHMDVGSFVLDAERVRWASDPGPQDYHSLETAGLRIWNGSVDSDRWKVFRYSNKVHNTLTINGKLQRAEAKCPITHRWADAKSKGVSGDLTDAYPDAKRVSRTVAIAAPGYAVVFDRITLRADGVIHWNMVTEANVIVHDNAWIELQREGRKMYMKVLAPGQTVVTTAPATPPAAYDAPNPGLTLVGFDVHASGGVENHLVVVMSTDESLRTLSVEDVLLRIQD